MKLTGRLKLLIYGRYTYPTFLVEVFPPKTPCLLAIVLPPNKSRRPYCKVVKPGGCEFVSLLRHSLLVPIPSFPLQVLIRLPLARGAVPGPSVLEIGSQPPEHQFAQPAIPTLRHRGLDLEFFDGSPFFDFAEMHMDLPGTPNSQQSALFFFTHFTYPFSRVLRGKS